MANEPDGSLRERLIDVGVELVTSEGTGSLGLREIARRAGVSHGAPRRYFPTHQSLLSAIARRGFGDLGTRFLAAGAARPAPREHVRALGRAYVGYALEQRGMFELMFRHDLLDSTGREPSGAPRLREQTLPLFTLLTRLVGACGAAEPEVTAAALWAGLHGVAQLWGYGSLPLVLGADATGDSGPPVDALVDAVVDAHLGTAAA
ncbi:TetR/AcrR family transcriptional regulator [Streptomyces sp. NPDC048352]|uniref:TetR/AcrR family transcriptional regulator n=1 Tax=Streptomyces sp. NPDC048352 TaxID=3154718 RepID=UPI0034349C75